MKNLWQALKERLGWRAAAPAETLEEAAEKVKRDLDALVEGPRPEETRPLEVESAEMPPAPSGAVPASAPVAEPELMFTGAFAIAWHSDRGQVRPRNEDAVLVMTGEQEGSDSVSPFALLLLADGMGGHQAGEMASSLATRVAAAHLLSELYIPLLEVRERASAQLSISEMMVNAVNHANRAVVQRLPGSGTTLTCGMVLGSRLFVAHVGDSRAYLLRPPDSLRLLTHDHSLVSRLVEMGQLTNAEAVSHPQRNVLYRAVGQNSALEVDIFTEVVESGDYILLCCDGLWSVVPEEEIGRIILSSASVHQAVRRLVEAANAAGGPDNITVILARIG